MKAKKNRKLTAEPIPSTGIRGLDCPALFKVRFDVSRKNISCFIGAKSLSKKLARKPSRPTHCGRKSTPKKAPSKPKAPVAKGAGKEVKRDGSPDIVREASNMILSKI